MANMLGRVCHFIAALAMACVIGGLQAQEKPETDEVRRKAMESRLVQIDKQVRELQVKLESESKKSPSFMKVCWHDIPRIQEWMDEAEARLKTLEASGARASEAKRLKEELATNRKAMQAVLMQAERREEVAQRIFTMQRLMTDLQAERGRLELDLKSMWR